MLGKTPFTSQLEKSCYGDTFACTTKELITESGKNSTTDRLRSDVGTDKRLFGSGKSAATDRRLLSRLDGAFEQELDKLKHGTERLDRPFFRSAWAGEERQASVANCLRCEHGAW